MNLSENHVAYGAPGIEARWPSSAKESVGKTDPSHEDGLKLWFADFPTTNLMANSVVEFTLFWKQAQHWEGRDWQVNVL
jgi:hypothetical protein